MGIHVYACVRHVLTTLLDTVDSSGRTGPAMMPGPRKKKNVHAKGVCEILTTPTPFHHPYRKLCKAIHMHTGLLLTSSLTLIKIKLFSYYCQLL